MFCYDIAARKSQPVIQWGQSCSSLFTAPQSKWRKCGYWNTGQLSWTRMKGESTVTWCQAARNKYVTVSQARQARIYKEGKRIILFIVFRDRGKHYNSISTTKANANNLLIKSQQQNYKEKRVSRLWTNKVVTTLTRFLWSTKCCHVDRICITKVFISHSFLVLCQY